MVTKKVRTEYMKKFREPKWETFSKCYEDSLKYRLTRRVMEHSHKPWFWEGGSVRSSGKSTPRTAGPRLGRNRVAPPPAAETNRPRSEEQQEVTEAADADAAAPADLAASENATGGPPNASVASREPDADDGPDANGDPAELTAAAASPLHHRDGRPGNGSPTDRKPERAKSQPPPGGAGDEAAAPNDQGERCDASVLTPPPPPDQRPATNHRRRARSADPDKLRRRQLMASAKADERWVTEYMRCFSARVDARPRL